MQKQSDKQREMAFRTHGLNKSFDWNEENVAKLLKLNDVLGKLMLKARRQQKAVERDIETLLTSGKKYYKDFDVDTCIRYDYTEKEEKIIGIDFLNYMDEQLKICWSAHPFSTDLDELSWNITSLNHPSLKDHTICYLMQVIFNHGHLPLQYGLLLNTKRFYVDTEIHL